MDDKNSKIEIAFTTLLEILEAEGFKIDVDLRLKLQKILHQFREEIRHEGSLDQDYYFGDLEKLRYYIRPLVVKSQNQQDVFDKAYDKYLRFVEAKTAYLIEKHKPPPSLTFWEKVERYMREHYIVFVSALAVVFLLSAFCMNKSREKPSVNLISALPDQLVFVGDSIGLEASLSGYFLRGSFTINDSLRTDKTIWFRSDNEILKDASYFIFNKEGSYKVELKATNLLTSNDSTIVKEISVSAGRPKIGFYSKQDSIDPMKVLFTPLVKYATMPYSINLLVNEEVVPSDQWQKINDSLFAFEFPRPDAYQIGMTLFMEKDSLRASSIPETILVCDRKPEIDFKHEVDPINPLRVEFRPEVSSAEEDYSLELKIDGRSIRPAQMELFTDSLMIYEFEDQGDKDVQLAVRNNKRPFNAHCDIAIRSRPLSLKSVILGESLKLKRADMTAVGDSMIAEIKKKSDLNVGVISYKGGNGLLETYRPMFQSVVDELQRYDSLSVSLDSINPEQITRKLLNGDLDVGIFTVVPYVEATARYPELTVAATHKIADKDYYNGFIIVRKNYSTTDGSANQSDLSNTETAIIRGADSIKELADFRDKRFTFVKQSSTSGYRIPKAIFELAKISADSTFFEVSFSGSHKESVSMLFRNETDGIAVDENRWDSMALEIDTSQFQILDKFRVPYNAYVLSPALSYEESGEIIESLLKTDPGENPLGIQTLMPINDGYYNELRHYLGLPRRKPGFEIDMMNLGKDTTTIDSTHIELLDSIQKNIMASARFADRDSTQYYYSANIDIDEDLSSTFRYNLFLNNKFLGSGQSEPEMLKGQLAKIVADRYLSALPIKARLFKDINGSYLIPYGARDGLNTEYIFMISGDTINPDSIEVKELETHLSGIDRANRLSSNYVYVSHPSRYTNPELYFSIFSTESIKSLSLSSGFILALFLLSIILVLFIIEVYVFRKWKPTASKELSLTLQFEGIKAPYELQLPNKNSLIRPAKDLYDISKRLKRRQESGTLKLDIFHSIRQTVKQAGFFKLFYRETTVVPEYLVILDRNISRAFHTELFKYLCQFLKEEDLFMDIFYFDNSPKFLKNHKYPTGISIEELVEKYPNHTLLFFTDGSKLVNQKMDRLFRWASEILPKWGSRYIMSPRNLTEWDRREAIIDLTIPVFPATIKGMLYLTECLTEKKLPDIDNRKLSLKTQENESYHDFDSVEGIKRFLRKEWIFQWFASLALYPKLHWPFAIAIGKALEEKYAVDDSTFEVNYDSLFRICQLTYHLERSMDNDLRLELMKQLNKRVELIAREAILVQLNELKIPEDSFINREVTVQKRLNYSLINPKNEQAQKDLFYLWKNNFIEDKASKKYLNAAHHNLTNKNADNLFVQVDRNSRQKKFRRTIIYGLAFIIAVILLNASLFQIVIKPDNPVLSKRIKKHIKKDRFTNYAAILNNRAVDLYESDSANLRVVDSLLELAGKDSLVLEAKANREVLVLNQALENYRSRDFRSTVISLDSLLLEGITDSLRLQALHYIGLSEYYLNETKVAEAYLDSIQVADSLFLRRINPNLAALLSGEENSICDKYNIYDRDEWRKLFLGFTSGGRWNVFIESLASSATKRDAEFRAQTYRRRYPNLDFNTMATINIAGNDNFRYAIVLAEGLQSEGQARDIADFAIQCGIAKDAFAQMQPNEGPPGDDLPEPERDSIPAQKIVFTEIVDDTDLVAYYPFSGNANDFSNKGNDGIVNGARLTNDRFGNNNSAYNFNGRNNNIDVEPNRSLDLTGDYTISVWIRPEAFRSLGGIISKYNSASSNGYTLRQSGFMGTATRTQGINLEEIETRTRLQLNQWYHIVAIKRDNIKSLYINGQSQQLYGTSSYETQANTDKLTIGSDYTYEPKHNDPRFFTGDIDDIRIYTRALAINEIRALYAENNWSARIGANILPSQGPELINQFRIYFDPSSTSLRPEAQSDVDSIVQLMKRFPAVNIRIEGYAYDQVEKKKKQKTKARYKGDAVEDIGPNEELSELLALTVAEYMMDQGIDPKRLEPVGYGSDNPDRRGENKVEFTVIE